AARHLLAAALRRVVAQGHAIVGVRDLDEPGARRYVMQRAEEDVRPLRDIATHFHERDDLPVVAEGGVQRGEGVGDPAPFLAGRLGGVAALDRVPHHRAQEPALLSSAHHARWTNTAAAPYTPAVPVRSPGTM